MPPTRAAELLHIYDEQLRGRPPGPLPAGVRVDRDGPLFRYHGLASGGFIDYRDLGGLDGPGVDGLIARQVEAFGELGERFEWKLHEHDLPSDLSARLLAAGFVPQDTETVVIATAADIAGEPRLPDGVSLREVESRADLERIAGLEQEVWQEESRVADTLEAERTADPDALAIFVAEAGGAVVCAAWVRFAPESEFATFWGGATLTAWRRRGIYRALVAHRARLAIERGYRYLEVDALEGSRPILERLGFVAVTTTTPYIWSPASGR